MHHGGSERDVFSYSPDTQERWFVGGSFGLYSERN